jgi:predicted transcriptional regulator
MSTIPDPNTHLQHVYAIDVKTDLIRRGIKQVDLAKMFDVSPAAISRAMSGYNRSLLTKIKSYLQYMQSTVA